MAPTQPECPCESRTNPRRLFEEAPLKELAESIRIRGVFSPLLVRPLTLQSLKIAFGARHFRAAQIAQSTTVPTHIVNMTDAEAMEAQLIAVVNLMRELAICNIFIVEHL